MQLNKTIGLSLTCALLTIPGQAAPTATESTNNSASQLPQTSALAPPSLFDKMPPWDGWGDPFYQSKKNPWIQSVEIHGRLNYQVIQLWGEDLNGDSFDDGYDELRRLWLGGKINFLNYFTLGGNAIFASDERPDGGKVNVEYQKFFDLYLATDLKKMFDLNDFDQLRFRYGRVKHNMSYTGRQSQRFNTTVERTALSNKLFYPFAAMSATLDVKHGRWSHQLSLYGTANDGANYGSLNYQEWGSWDEGLAVYWWNRYDVSEAWGFDKAYLHAEAAYNFADEDDSSWLGYRWAGTISTFIEQDRWTLLMEAAIGDNGDDSIGLTNPDRQGMFYGAQVESTYWLVKKSLEGVAQFSWMNSDNPEGIRLDRRYVGLPHETSGGQMADLNNRFGDNHYSIYIGLNFYLPDHRNKIMAGVEWEQLSVEDKGKAEVTTLWLAYRMFF